MFGLLLVALAADPAPATARFEGQLGDPFGTPARAADVPDRFTYDPVAQKSYPNTGSLRVAGAKGSASGVRLAVPAAASFTVECFARPDGLKTQSGQYYPLIVKSRRTPAAADVRVNVFTSYPGHVYDWVQAAATAGNDTRHLDFNRFGGPTMLRKDSPWRHWALVVDAKAKTVAFYCDYTELARAPLDATFDDGPVVVGGDPAGNGFAGLLDEVRYTPAVLEPHQFLHALPHPLEGVSLASPAGKLPKATGYADLRTRFGAVGDGKTDDTHAFRKAFRDLADVTHLVGHQTLYIPDGTYLVSDTVRFSRYLTIHGQSRGKTVLKLKDAAAGFTDPAKPRPVLSTGFQPYEENVAKGPGGNVTHGNYVHDLTIDTGRGNAGAVGFDYQGHNHSAVYNLTIRSGDGAGVTGLDFLRPWPGPCLVRDLAVEGFDYGVRARHKEYGFTLSRVRLTGQRKAGVENHGNAPAIEELDSTNTVPAVVNRKGGGQVVLINSKLAGGAADAPAIVNEAECSLFVRNVETTGYGVAVRDGDKTLPAGKVTEYVTGEPVSGFPVKEAKSLNLPVEQPPEVPWGAPAEWANVRDFEAKVTKDGDWAPAIQAAIDSGAKTVYFPINGAAPAYVLKSPVHVRGQVVRLYGLRVSLQADAKALGDRPGLVFDGPQKAVVVEGISTPSARHASAVDLVLRCSGIDRLDADAGCGKLFLEDYLPALRLNKHQRVWARHLNIETEQTKIVNDGGRLWVLGYKTEIGSCNLLNKSGARTELLGGLVYVTSKPAAGVPMVENHDSDVSWSHVISSYVGGHAVFAKESRNGETREVKPNDAVKWLAGRPLVHLYVAKRE